MKNFIIDQLIENKNKEIVSFHTPGHKNGRIYEELGYSDVLKKLYKIDTTEIIGTDNLHLPEGIIKKAQNRAAKVFNAKHTYFLINGSTCGIQASILSVCNKYGSKIIVNRDCHQSVVNTCILGNIEPVYINCQICEKSSVLKGVNFKDVKEVIDENLDAKALVLTYPTYYGMTYDLKKICDYAHNNGIIVIVDEAHGAHLELSEDLPMSSLCLGADIVIQSCHKTLPSFTQSSLLHVGSNIVDIDRLSSFLRILESSSPSYLLLASLEISIDIYEKHGNKLMKELLNNIENFKIDFEVENLDNIDNLLNGKSNLVHDKNRQSNGLSRDVCVHRCKKDTKGLKIYQTSDKTKFFISLKELGIDGYKLEEMLRYDHNIQVELSNHCGVLLLCSIANNIKDFKKLKDALIDIRKDVLIFEFLDDKREVNDIKFPKTLPEKIVSPSQAFYKHTKSVKIDESVGKVCAECITPYPPGVNIISPGEIIESSIIKYILYCKENGMNISGTKDKDLNFIEVIDDI
nr:aminotransferase class I/II-fold pyridoxal phosphate-dependent enzyme [Clostridioides sp.]